MWTQLSDTKISFSVHVTSIIATVMVTATLAYVAAKSEPRIRTVALTRYAELEGEQPLALQGGLWETERMAQLRLSSKYGNNLEHRNWDDTRVDILTEFEAIEIDFAAKWAEAIGQSLYYAEVTRKSPAIILLVKDKEQDSKYIYRCQTLCAQYKIKLYVEQVMPRSDSVSAIRTTQQKQIEVLKSNAERHGEEFIQKEAPLTGDSLRRALQELSRNETNNPLGGGIPSEVRGARTGIPKPNPAGSGEDSSKRNSGDSTPGEPVPVGRESDDDASSSD